jgi:hypothetical protein
MILKYSDLRSAEQNLSRLNGIKSKPKVIVIDREGAGGSQTFVLSWRKSKESRQMSEPEA